jgi:hypothetical protein
MHFRQYPETRDGPDLLPGIAPVFRVDLERGDVCLIGTGFWVTTEGHLVTARHVVEENLHSDGTDRGPIFAVQTLPDRSIVARNFKKSDMHPVFDLALSETVVAPTLRVQSTSPIVMTLDEPKIGEPVFSFAVLADGQSFEDEKLPGLTIARFAGHISAGPVRVSPHVQFAVRLSLGYVTDIFDVMRDSVMLPFPCIQTDVAIYGGNSGGPLLDVRGRVCAVNCTSFGGNDVSFHVPTRGVLQLQARAASLGSSDAARPRRSILELGATQTILFEPPLLDADKPVRSVLRWVWYAAKCLARREWPSIGFHFASFQ